MLITLGIIGVVAAMTLPALIQNYQKNVIKQQFKKSYSIAQNAYKMAEARLGYTPACYYGYNWVSDKCAEYDKNGNCIKYDGSGNGSEANAGSDCKVLKEELKKVFKVVKICEKNALKNKCIPEYDGNDTVYKESHDPEDDVGTNQATSGCSAWRESPIHNTREVWNLADGTIILWYDNNSARLFAMDVNGMKGPNKWGHDLFSFNLFLTKSKALKIKDGNCSITQDGGISTGAMLKSLYK